MTTFTSEQRFIVTGASSGIGETVALQLNEEGATVIGIARNRERLEAMKAKAKHPENVFLEQKDLTEDIEGLPAYVKSLKDKYGKFSGMAYCAGIAFIQPLQSLDYGELKRIFDINYFAPIQMVKGVSDKRNNVGAGTSIVAIASIAALARDKGLLSYVGSKAALIASLSISPLELNSPQYSQRRAYSTSDTFPIYLSRFTLAGTSRCVAGATQSSHCRAMRALVPLR